MPNSNSSGTDNVDLHLDSPQNCKIEDGAGDKENTEYSEFYDQFNVKQKPVVVTDQPAKLSELDLD